nr:MAG TPA: hypothetical protein [Bacteriophage sp.]
MMKIHINLNKYETIGINGHRKVPKPRYYYMNELTLPLL